MAFVTFMLVLAAAIVVVPLAVVWSSYNRLMALDARCETAEADVDVHLKHRHNLIPGLVETVRGFAKHESKLLTEVTRARASALGAATPEVKMEAETQLGQSVAHVLQVAERYPEIAASGHFAALRQELVDAENRITASRRFSNLAIEEYNATLRQFPGSLIGQFRRLGTRRPFDLGIERVLFDEPVAIKF
jgi:LemA protein